MKKGASPHKRYKVDNGANSMDVLYESVLTRDFVHVKSILSQKKLPHYVSLKSNKRIAFLLAAGEDIDILSRIFAAYDNEITIQEKMVASETFLEKGMWDAFNVISKNVLNEEQINILSKLFLIGVNYLAHKSRYNLIIKDFVFARCLLFDFNKCMAAGIKLKENADFYKAIFEKGLYFRPWIDLFIVFSNLGMHYEENKFLYEKAIEMRNHAVALWGGVFNITYYEMPLEVKKIFFKAMLDNAEVAHKLLDGLELMFKNDYHYAQYPLIYMALSTQPNYAKKLAKSFCSLLKAGVRYQENETLYEALIEQPNYAKKLAESFCSLLKAGVSYQENETLYEALIEQPRYAENLSKGFLCLLESGILYRGNKKLYAALMSQPGHAKNLASGFCCLFTSRLVYNGNEFLYDNLIKKACFAEDLAYGFVRLHSAGLGYAQNFDLYDGLIRRAAVSDELAYAILHLFNTGDVNDVNMLYDNFIFSNFLSIRKEKLEPARCKENPLYDSFPHFPFDAISSMLSFDELKKYLNQSELFFSDKALTEQEGRFIVSAIAARKMSTLALPRFIYRLEINEYIKMISAFNKPFKESFILYDDLHWNTGVVRLNDKMHIDIFIFDSLMRMSVIDLDVEFFNSIDCTIFIPNMDLQHDFDSCSIFAIEGWRRLQKLHRFLPEKYQGDEFDYFYKHVTSDYTNRGFSKGKVRCCEFPLYLMRLYQSRQLFNVISAREEENKLACNKKGEFYIDACKRDFFSDRRNHSVNHKVTVKRNKMQHAAINYLNEKGVEQVAVEMAAILPKIIN